MSEAPGNSELMNQMKMLADSRKLRPPEDIIRDREIMEAARKPKRPKQKMWWIR